MFFDRSLSFGIRHLLLLIAPLLIVPAKSVPSERENCFRVYHHQSIQEAIDRASPGDRIDVEEGVCYEQLTIKKDGIKLIGNGASLRLPTVFLPNLCTGLSRTPQGNDTEAGICIHGYDVELEDYAQEHRKVKSVGNFIKSVYVTGFTVSGFEGENIAAVGAHNVNIIKNTLIDGGQYGFLSVGSQGIRAEGNKVITTAINIIGLLVDDYSDATLSHNYITGYSTALVSQTPGGLITDNKAYNICVGGAADPGVKGSLIIDNTSPCATLAATKTSQPSVPVLSSSEQVRPLSKEIPLRDLTMVASAWAFSCLMGRTAKLPQTIRSGKTDWTTMMWIFLKILQGSTSLEIMHAIAYPTALLHHSRRRLVLDWDRLWGMGAA